MHPFRPKHHKALLLIVAFFVAVAFLFSHSLLLQTRYIPTAASFLGVPQIDQ